MLNKITAFLLVLALVSTMCSSSALANSKANVEEVPEVTKTPEKNNVQPNEKLKADMAKLVADAKAGKVAPPERPQIQPAKSNNLSKGTKIAIGVGIAVAVVAIVLIARGPRVHAF